MPNTAILDEERHCLEQGEAELVLGVWWDYHATSRGRIQVEAWDLAGNVTQRGFDDPWKLNRFSKKTN